MYHSYTRDLQHASTRKLLFVNMQHINPNQDVDIDRMHIPLRNQYHASHAYDLDSD